MPRLRELHVPKKFDCSFHNGFYSEVKAGAPSLKVNMIMDLLHMDYEDPLGTFSDMAKNET